MTVLIKCTEGCNAAGECESCHSFGSVLEFKTTAGVKEKESERETDTYWDQRWWTVGGHGERRRMGAAR